MTLTSGKTRLEQLQSEMQALQDLLPFLTGERRERAQALIADLEQKIVANPLSTVVVVTTRKAA